MVRCAKLCPFFCFVVKSAFSSIHFSVVLWRSPKYVTLSGDCLSIRLSVQLSIHPKVCMLQYLKSPSCVCPSLSLSLLPSTLSARLLSSVSRSLPSSIHHLEKLLLLQCSEFMYVCTDTIRYDTIRFDLVKQATTSRVPTRTVYTPNSSKVWRRRRRRRQRETQPTRLDCVASILYYLPTPPSTVTGTFVQPVLP